MSTAARICRYAAIVFYIGLGAQAIWSGVNQFMASETLGQRAQTALQFAFGGLGIAAGVFLIVRASVPLAIEWGWVVALGFAGGVAAVVWGETPIPIGIVGGVASAIVALVIVWLGRRGSPPIPDES